MTQAYNLSAGGESGLLLPNGAVNLPLSKAMLVINKTNIDSEGTTSQMNGKNFPLRDEGEPQLQTLPKQSVAFNVDIYTDYPKFKSPMGVQVNGNGILNNYSRVGAKSRNLLFAGVESIDMPNQSQTISKPSVAFNDGFCAYQSMQQMTMHPKNDGGTHAARSHAPCMMHDSSRVGTLSHGLLNPETQSSGIKHQPLILLKSFVAHKNGRCSNRPQFTQSMRISAKNKRGKETAENLVPNTCSMHALSDNCDGDDDIPDPDLLSGFDKHVSSMQQNAADDTSVVLKSHPLFTALPVDSHFFAGDISHASPFVTSKSFDELHKWPGEGILKNVMSHCDLNEVSGIRDPVTQGILMKSTVTNLEDQTTTPFTDNNSTSSTVHGSIFSCQETIDESNHFNFHPVHMPQSIEGPRNGSDSSHPENHLKFHFSSTTEMVNAVLKHSNYFYSNNLSHQNMPGSLVESADKLKKRSHSEMGSLLQIDCNFSPCSKTGGSKRFREYVDASVSHSLCTSEQSSDGGFKSEPVSSTDITSCSQISFRSENHTNSSPESSNFQSD